MTDARLAKARRASDRWGLALLRVPLDGLGRSLVLVDDGSERQLAAVVDLGDLDLDLLADAEHVFDVLDPLATRKLADLRDVEETVAARHERHECAEGRDLDDGT